MGQRRRERLESEVRWPEKVSREVTARRNSRVTCASCLCVENVLCKLRPIIFNCRPGLHTRRHAVKHRDTLEAAAPRRAGEAAVRSLRLPEAWGVAVGRVWGEGSGFPHAP